MIKLKNYLILITLLVFVFGCGDDDGPMVFDPPSGSVTQSLTVEAGSSGTITGNFTDPLGISSITATNTDLGISETINVGGATSFALSAEVSVPANTPAGDYDVLITVTNTENVSADFTVSITVTEPCPATSFDGGVADGTADFTDSNDDYPFDDYSEGFSDIAIEINGDCTILTLTGDFLGWQETIDETFTPVLNLNITSGPDGSTSGTLAFDEEIMGPMADGFTYRMSKADEDGTYDEASGNLTMKLYIEYEVDGNWVYWYTTTMTMTLK